MGKNSVSLRGKDVLALADFSADEIQTILETAKEMKNIIAQLHTFSECSRLQHIESCGEIGLVQLYRKSPFQSRKQSLFKILKFYRRSV